MWVLTTPCCACGGLGSNVATPQFFQSCISRRRHSEATHALQTLMQQVVVSSVCTAARKRHRNNNRKQEKQQQKSQRMYDWWREDSSKAAASLQAQVADHRSCARYSCAQCSYAQCSYAQCSCEGFERFVSQHSRTHHCRTRWASCPVGKAQTRKPGRGSTQSHWRRGW